MSAVTTGGSGEFPREKVRGQVPEDTTQKEVLFEAVAFEADQAEAAARVVGGRRLPTPKTSPLPPQNPPERYPFRHPLYTAYPFSGSRRMTAVLRREGYAINRQRVQRRLPDLGL
jgi:hypothetical protein